MRDEARVAWIGICKKTTMRNTIGFVIETLGIDGIKAVKCFVFEDLSVKLRDPVYRVRENDGNICHSHDTVPKHSRLGKHIMPVVLVMRERFVETAVDFLDKHVGTRQKRAEHSNRPALKRFGHDRVIGVGERFFADLKGVVELNALFIDQNPHELRTTYSGMRIVCMNSYEIGKVRIIGPVLFLKCRQNRMKACAHKKIFLFKAQKTSVLARIIWIENLRNCFDACTVCLRLCIITRIKCSQIKTLLGRLCTPQA